MKSLQRVLAATDLSSPSRHAVVRAAIVAAHTGAALDLVRVVDLPKLEVCWS